MAAPLVPGRTCGPCHLCCKVYPIEEVGKPDCAWCPRLSTVSGCTAYAARPAVCRDFFCTWMRDPKLDAAWRPDVAGFVLSDPEPWAMLASVDPDRPDAWRREPYLSTLRGWSAACLPRKAYVGVRIGERVLLTTPDGDIEIAGTGS